MRGQNPPARTRLKRTPLTTGGVWAFLGLGSLPLGLPRLALASLLPTLFGLATSVEIIVRAHLIMNSEQPRRRSSMIATGLILAGLSLT